MSTTSTQSTSFGWLEVASKVNYFVAAGAALVAFMVAPIWYSQLLFGKIWLALRPGAVSTPPVIEILGEYGRILLVACVLSILMERLNITGWLDALKLGAGLWLGFQAMAVLGSVLHEGYPWQLYLIHTGHALAYMIVLSVLLGFWRQRKVQISQAE